MASTQRLSVLILCSGILFSSCENKKSSQETLKKEPAAVKSGIVQSIPKQSQQSSSKEVNGAFLSPEQIHQSMAAKNPSYIRTKARYQLRGHYIVFAEIKAAGVIDITPLKGIKLEGLVLAGNKIKDLSPLKDMPLKSLDILQTAVSDITPLQGMPLQELFLDETFVSDISPLKGMQIKKLYLNNTSVSSIAALQGMPLKELNLFGTAVTDLKPLKGAPLEMLWLNETPVSDISPLRNAPLVSLTLHRTQVTDLSPLANKSIQRLHIGQTPVTDLTPLKDLLLTRLIFTPSRIKKGLSAIQKMKSLSELGTNFENRTRPQIFWALHAAGKLK